MTKEIKKPLGTLKYGDKVFHVCPALSKRSQVANIHEFKGLQSPQVRPTLFGITK